MFDFGFTKFVTSKVISFFWVLFVIIYILACVGTVVGGIIAGIFGSPERFILVLAPIPLTLYLLIIRMGYEFIIIVFRIETHLRAIREQNENK